MGAMTKTRRRNPTPTPEAARQEPARGVETLLGEALNAWSSGRREHAQDLLRRAAVCDLRRPEAWYWIGRMQEEDGDPLGAAYSYFMARDRHYEPASVALRRMGRLNQEV